MNQKRTPSGTRTAEGVCKNTTSEVRQTLDSHIIGEVQKIISETESKILAGRDNGGVSFLQAEGYVDLCLLFKKYNR